MNRQTNDWALAAEKVGIKLITTGNVFALLAIVIIGGIIWKLDSADLKQVLLQIISATWIAALGWILLAMTIVASIVIVRAQARFYDQELTGVCKVRDQLIQNKLGLELPSSKDT